MMGGKKVLTQNYKTELSFYSVLHLWFLTALQELFPATTTLQLLGVCGAVSPFAGAKPLVVSGQALHNQYSMLQLEGQLKHEAFTAASTKPRGECKGFTQVPEMLPAAHGADTPHKGQGYNLQSTDAQKDARRC